MKRDRQLSKHTPRKDLGRILTGLRLRVEGTEIDRKSKEKSNKDENGVGKSEKIEAYLTPWTGNSRKTERTQ